jgi:hypothetical protein
MFTHAVPIMRLTEQAGLRPDAATQDARYREKCAGVIGQLLLLTCSQIVIDRLQRIQVRSCDGSVVGTSKNANTFPARFLHSFVATAPHRQPETPGRSNAPLGCIFDEGSKQ